MAVIFYDVNETPISALAIDDDFTDPKLWRIDADGPVSGYAFKGGSTYLQIGPDGWISIQDAPRHPAFSYRPETGEDPYHAFLGVPILKGGRVICPAQNIDRIADVAFADGKVQAIGDEIAPVPGRRNDG